MKATLGLGEIVAGKFRVEREIGKGGMGVVVEATHLQLGRRVAIKFLIAGTAPQHRKRFKREARAVAKLHGEHVVKVIDVGELEEGGIPYMVMELLEGTDLAEELKNSGQFSVKDAVDYLLQACEALAEAHAAGIIHRDLKPANLFLTRAPDGSKTVKVLDFGIAKVVEDDPDEAETQLTRAADQMGTPRYMSPEQIKDAHEVDERSDIWALGTILYQFVTGKTPFHLGSGYQVAMMIREESPPPPSSLRADLPPRLEEVILRCLEKEPEQRFASVADFAAAIAPFGPRQATDSVKRIAATLAASRRGSAAAQSALSVIMAPTERGRRRTWAIAGGAGLLLGVLVGAIVLIREARMAQPEGKRPTTVSSPASSFPEERPSSASNPLPANAASAVTAAPSGAPTTSAPLRGVPPAPSSLTSSARPLPRKPQPGPAAAPPPTSPVPATSGPAPDPFDLSPDN